VGIIIPSSAIAPKPPLLLADKTLMRNYKSDNSEDDFATVGKYDRLFRVNLKIYELKWYPKGITCLTPGHRSVKPANVPPLMVRKAQWRR
jgi:hypothetical protein